MAQQDKLSFLLIKFVRTLVARFAIQRSLDHLVQRIIAVLRPGIRRSASRGLVGRVGLACAALGAVVLGAGACVPPTLPANFNGSGGYVARWDTDLFLNGRLFRFTGFDSFVMMGCGYSYENLDAAGRDYYFAHLRANSVTRIWLFPGANLAQSDQIVASAKKYDQRIVFTLTDSVGGCGDTVKDQNWFANGYKGTYLNWIRRVVPHYANTPTLAFWELINEPGQVDNATLRRFFDTAGGLVHSLDHHHLVSSGTQPPWAYGGEAGYQYISASPGIDIMSMHEYDQVPAASGHLAPALVAARADRKPLFIGEYGIVASPTGNGGSCESFSQRANVVAAKLRSDFSHPEVAGALYWSYKNDYHSDCDLDTFAWDPLVKVIHNIAMPRN